MMTDPGPAVLADLLVSASEHSTGQLVATDRLLRETVGPDPVNAAHREWTDRLWEGITGIATVPESGTPKDALLLLRSIRATAPSPRRGSR